MPRPKVTTPEHFVTGDGDSSLLFLHGLGGDHTSWEPQMRHFGRTHRCAAWTMPGYGSSPPLPELSFQALADAAVDLIRHLDLRDVTIVGLAVGGMVAQQVALSYPDQIANMVLVATPAAFAERGSAHRADFMASRLAPLDGGLEPADFAADVVAGLGGERLPPPVAAAATASMSRINASAYRDAVRCTVGWDARERLPSLRVPALCVAGDLDTTTTVESVTRLADLLADGTVEVIADAGHLMNLERPAAFNAVLERFVT